MTWHLATDFLFTQVNTQFEQVGETQFLCTIPDADSINHVVVFMTGQVPFPEGAGGAGEYRLNQLLC